MNFSAGDYHLYALTCWSANKK